MSLLPLRPLVARPHSSRSQPSSTVLGWAWSRTALAFDVPPLFSDRYSRPRAPGLSTGSQLSTDFLFRLVGSNS